MSSPLAKSRKSTMDRALISTHQRVSHHHRIELLAEALATRIHKLPRALPGRPVRLLDVGCGDMRLADAVHRRLGETELRCADIHPCPPSVADDDPRWRRYTRFDGVNLPFEDGRFDVVMFCDVLHHVPEPQRVPLLAGAARVARHVLIKDHFEYGWVSRQVLRAMDWFGNASYGVSVPSRYFDQAGFAQLCQTAGLSEQSLDIGLDLYEHLPVLRHALRRDWHFFAVCTHSAAGV